MKEDPICIACYEPINEEDPGMIIGGVFAGEGALKPEEQEIGVRWAYHHRCREQALIIEENNRKGVKS